MKFFVFVTLATLSISSVFAAERNDNDISQFVSNYFNAVENCKATLKFDTDEISRFFSSKDNKEIIYLDTLIKHRSLQISDLKYNRFSLDISINSVDESNGKIKVNLTKNASIYFRCMKNIESMEIETHTLTLTKSDGRLKIVEDDHTDEFKDNLMENKKEPAASVREKAKKNLAEEKKNVEKQKQELKNTNVNAYTQLDTEESDEMTSSFVFTAKTSSFKKHAYNREAAKKYALKYVLKPNKNYVNFESMGGNCTNFTSQCLKAGGIVQDKTGNYKWYYTSSSNRAPSWSKANDFRNYYRKNKGSKTVKGLNANRCNFQATRLGDLAQIVILGEAKHSIFISGAICDAWVGSTTSELAWKSKYDVYICKNSIDKSSRKKNVPMSSLYSISTSEYIHINGSYY